MEKDKTLLNLSAAGIGLLTTLGATVGPANWFELSLYVLAAMSFVAAIVTAVRIFDGNSKHLHDVVSLRSQSYSGIIHFTKYLVDVARQQPCTLRRVSAPKCFVYILKNRAKPPRYYTGLTSNVMGRLEFHNARKSVHTSNGCPWDIDVVIEFHDEARATRFEKYLKSGSGCAFSSTSEMSQPSLVRLKPDTTYLSRL